MVSFPSATVISTSEPSCSPAASAACFGRRTARLLPHREIFDFIVGPYSVDTLYIPRSRPRSKNDSSSARQRLSKLLQQHLGALLAELGVVEVVEEGALLGEEHAG